MAIALLGSTARLAMADEGPITLNEGRAEVTGTTVGSESLTQLAARDRHRKLCLGYGASEPDHTLELTERRDRLQIAVESGGQDTTLLVLGPNGIDCNDNRRRGDRDAAVADTDWPAGTYRIWVGSFNRGDRIDYTLQITTPAPASNRVR